MGNDQTKEESKLFYIYLDENRVGYIDLKICEFDNPSTAIKLSDLRKKIESYFNNMIRSEWVADYGDLKDGNFKFIYKMDLESQEFTDLEERLNIFDIKVRKSSSYDKCIFIRRGAPKY